MLCVNLQKLRTFSHVNLYKMQTSMSVNNILLEYMHIYLSTYLWKNDKNDMGQILYGSQNMKYFLADHL